MSFLPQETDDDEQLLQRVRAGDKEVIGVLFAQHRDRLRNQVAQRLDPAIHRRVDASDIVQETLITASRRIDEYLERKPMPFHRWLWKTALETLIMERRKHFNAAGHP